MAFFSLTEVDSIEITVVVDNEVDPISPSNNPAVKCIGPFQGLAIAPVPSPESRGGATVELRMDKICCGAHGLSLLIAATKGDKKHTILFDAGPEEAVWERNASRLRADIGSVEHIHLSHWHRDHSGGLPRAIKLINAAKSTGQAGLTVGVHSDRPDFRGVMTAGGPISLEADPTFDEIEQAGGILDKKATAHTILDDMFLVSGEIPRTTAYEAGLKGGIRYEKASGKWTPDESITDERMVICNLKGKGLVVFTGCSHAGVVNVSRHAIELGQGQPLYAVVGGYHLADNQPEKLSNSLHDLKKLEPKVLMPGHCTGYKFKSMLEHALPGSLVPSFVGTKYTLA